VPWPLQGVIEMPSYIAWASGVFTQEEQQQIVDVLADNPTIGDLLKGTGGIRKFRYATAGRGKSGGVRIIYYFHSERIPLYLIAGFAKNEKANLTNAERNALRKWVEDNIKE
jgi:hypothetical protein